MIVMKFGGSSVANGDRIRHVVEIVKAELPRKPVLVLSAMGDTTDRLLEAAAGALETGGVSVGQIAGLHIKTIQELALGPAVRNEAEALLEELRNLLLGISMIKELTPRTRDYLVSFGERLSVRIAAAYCKSIGVPSCALDAWDAGFISDSHFSSAELLKESWDLIPKTLIPLADQGILPVVTGFIAKNEAGRITTLGRGGSDRSATIIAAACKAEEAQVWKDVDGILSADPRLVPSARPVEAVTYEEASELAYFGAQVLHPWAMRPCMKSGTPVLVKNSYNPKAPGTRIHSGPERRSDPVLAITSRKNITLVDILSTRMLGQYGFLKEVFSDFARHGISVDMVATSEVSISVSLDSVYDLEGLKADLTRIASVDIKRGRAIVTIIGDVNRSSEILHRAFSVCARGGIPVQMVSVGASKVNISFIVQDDQAARAVQDLHEEFFPPPPKRDSTA
ncbi:MAG: aspartate kinase [Spirochaetaceae bacterium]|jgi:aspartate kinase|nr:aspartate kinase [Spirochaetaceae bacterium]